MSEKMPVQEDNKISGESSKIQKYKPSTADMTHYYTNFLPFKLIFQWLNHSPIPSNDFTHREFAFEYKSGAYQRYNSFQNAQDFKQTVIKSQPTRFEVGAVYPIEPKLRKTVSKNVMKPISKEFVLDIDLTDYDEVRTCCSGTDICPKCWKFINLAISIIDIALRDDFGIVDRIWVFSGRRGVHCWVSDQRVRLLDEQRRRAMVEYLDVLNVKNKTKKGSIGLKKPYHPHVERSFNLLKDEFVDIILKEQNSWWSEESEKELAKNIPDYRLSNELLKRWQADPGRNSADKWVDIGKLYEEMNIKSFELIDWKKEMIFKTLYPRLDVEVSRQMIHLLKSPFCVHPGTGNVCVPFDPELKQFNPFTDAPTLQKIFTEDENDWEKTSLKDSVNLFSKFVNNVMKRESRDKRNRSDEDGSIEF